MTPTHAIETIDSQLIDVINRLRASLCDEASQIQEEWDALGRAGGQRDDHASTLLGRLRPILSALATHCDVCEKQIDALVYDPFGTKGARGVTQATVTP